MLLCEAMRIAIFCALTFLIGVCEARSPPAAIGAPGDWRLVASSDEDDYYLQREVQFADGYARAWVLVNYLTPQQDANDGRWFRSAISLDEYDCHESRHRSVQMTTYTGPLGQGDVVFSLRHTSEWRFPVPGSVGNRLAKEVCLTFRKEVDKTTR